MQIPTPCILYITVLFELEWRLPIAILRRLNLGMETLKIKF